MICMYVCMRVGMYVCMCVGMQSMQNYENVFGIQLSFQVQQHLVFLVIKNWTEHDSHNTSSQVFKKHSFVSTWSSGRMEHIEESRGTWTREIGQCYFPLDHATQVCIKCRGSQRGCGTILQVHGTHFMARQALTNSYWTYNVASSKCRKTEYFHKFVSSCKIQFIYLLSW